MKMSLHDWYVKYDLAAKTQGWSLFDADGEIMIQKIDEPEDGSNELADDMVALDVVFWHAAAGDKGALLALFLDGKNVHRKGFDTHPNLKMEKFDVPDFLAKTETVLLKGFAPETK